MLSQTSILEPHLNQMMWSHHEFRSIRGAHPSDEHSSAPAHTEESADGALAL